MYKDKNDQRSKEAKLRWYRKNKEKQIARQMERRKEVKEWYRNYKSTLKCEKCSENHPACLDFHHVDSKTKEDHVSLGVHECWTKERILKEIAKCQVLCSNCHRKWHFEND